MKALLVIDVQNDFYESGQLPIPEASLINQPINQLLNSMEYELIVASQDWHPADHLSFATNHQNKKSFVTYDNQPGIGPLLWPVHCVQKTQGAKFNPEINTEKFDYILRKGKLKTVDSYSAFADNDGSNLGLAGLLNSLKVDEIDICGLAFDYCVKYTALDGIKNNFKVNIIGNATKAVAPEQETQLKDELKKAGIIIK
ncbi:nicotinamidase [Halanaerobium salsuginis]|uniref:nicotinamidase n=1 Tax=Halanaerobium salsuginis TaxID=29563 RepID=A0A1I4F7I2_9FIRM|nr:nicotinamidase [Halanaerobium salsuginis]SFL13479.1 nicotinamidase/pyrazinamidase [Halanaerobium salsuginis]